MVQTNYYPWLHRLVIATALVALLPIVVGALVTTLDAGMAFSDWPSSDGHGMFSYPWLQSAGDEFVEHGHRLAGVVIGIFSIGLACAVWRWESRRWVRWAGVAVLLAVIVQGLIGGFRVLADERAAALFHSAFAACIFTLIGAVALFTSRRWLNAQPSSGLQNAGHLKALAVIVPFVLLIQYLLGGLLRHFGRGLFEHVGFAFVALIFCTVFVKAAFRTREPWLRRAAAMLLLFIVVQLSLGAGAWVTKYGLASWGIVAIQHSLPQIILRTAHTVVGMLVLMAAVNLSLRVFRLSSVSAEQSQLDAVSNQESPMVPVQGGVA